MSEISLSVQDIGENGLPGGRFTVAPFPGPTTRTGSLIDTREIEGWLDDDSEADFEVSDNNQGTNPDWYILRVYEPVTNRLLGNWEIVVRGDGTAVAARTRFLTERPDKK